MKFHLFSILIFLCVIVQFFMNSFDLPLQYAIYPYILIPVIGFIGLTLTPKNTYPIKKVFIAFCIFFLLLYSIFYFQMHTLKENYFYVLYSFRFYFGGIFMIICLLYAYRSTSYHPANIKKSFLNFTALIIILNLSLCILEILYAKMFNNLAPWTPPERFNEDISLIQTFFGAYRAYGFTDNCAVLGGFSVFLTTYYVSQTFHCLRVRDWLVITAGISTIALSQSGTGFFIGSIAIFSIAIYSLCQRKYILPLIVLFGSIISFILFAQVQFSTYGRFSLNSIESLWLNHGANVIDFFNFAMKDNPYKWIFGALNFQKFAIQGLAYDQVANNSSLYDFAYIALVVESGFLGLAIYLGFYAYITSIAFPKQPLAKLSIILLMLTSLHYGVSFWICSQVMSAAILAFHIHLNNIAKMYPHLAYDSRKRPKIRTIRIPLAQTRP